MVKYHAEPAALVGGELKTGQSGERNNTMAYQILNAHNKPGSAEGKFRVTFDALMSHDITYVSIIQTARAGGMTKFPVPYVLTNCHNSLCAVGGTINADDHAFGLSAAQKYGGTYVAPNEAVCHQYIRENLAAPGKMILGSDSHTRYGQLGTLGIGEGGGELVKQLLGDTYDVDAPDVVLVWVTGKLPKGVGPHDVAISMCGELFPDGRVKNKILEFAGPGLDSLSLDYKTGIDVMTTETSCLSSIWVTPPLPPSQRGEDAKTLARKGGDAKPPSRRGDVGEADRGEIGVFCFFYGPGANLDSDISNTTRSNNGIFCNNRFVVFETFGLNFGRHIFFKVHRFPGK
jgi:aconitate hydratase